MISLNAYHKHRISWIVLLISAILLMHYYDVFFAMLFLLVVMGVALWFILNHLFFSPPLFQQLATGVRPLLEALSEDKLDTKSVMSNLLEMISGYPEWVYRLGFNPGLRAGFRFFLIHLEHVSDLYFSIDYYEHDRIGADALAEWEPLLSRVKKNNQRLLKTIIDRLQCSSIVKTDENYIDDMSALSEAIKKRIPAHLSLMDVVPDSISLSAYLQDLIDLRHVLLQLVAALPVN